MPLRALVVSLLGLIPLSGNAQNAWQALTEESRLGSAIGSVMSYMRSERPRRGLDLHDNLNLWQQSLGMGAQVEMSKNWTLRLDLDRYRPKFPGAIGRESVDAVMLGVQYRLDGG